MARQLTNLLPSARREALAREYYFRFGVVVVSLCVFLGAVAAIFLVPTYVFLTGSMQEKQTRLADIKSTLSSADEEALSARLKALSNDTARLTALSNKQSASSIMRSALAIPRPGIVLSGFTYTPVAGKSPGTLVVSGTAGTRDVLRQYQLALQGAAFVQSANLPVSAYAKDTNIAFAITLTLAP